MWTGDNLPIMRGMNSESVDLIYLDPPFNSKADYAAPVGSMAAGAEFKDTWTLQDVDVAWLDLIQLKHPKLNRVIDAAMTDSDKSYLIYMAARLLEMHRILKPTGSIYLHCDPTMSHYLKLLMDAIWGRSKSSDRKKIQVPQRNRLVLHGSGQYKAMVSVETRCSAMVFQRRALDVQYRQSQNPVCEIEHGQNQRDIRYCRRAG